MRSPTARRVRVPLPTVAIICVSLLAAACSTGAPSTSPAASDQDAMSPDEPGGHAEEFSFGTPGDPSDADRVIEVRMIDPFEFDPAQIEVAAGETVTFRIANIGDLDHEFVIGDEATQDEHEVMMDDSSMMDEEPNELALAGGESGELTWTFAQASALRFGCHVPGHYGAGMVGTFEVSS